MSGENVRWPVSRVLYPPERMMAIHLGRLLPDASCNQPGWRPGNGLSGKPDMSPLFGLAPGGVCRAAPVTSCAVRSYRTLSPLPASRGPRQAVCFLWHFPWGRPRRTLSGTVFPWSPDFPPCFSRERHGDHPAIW